MGTGRLVLIVVAVAASARLVLRAGELPARVPDLFDWLGRPYGWGVPRGHFIASRVAFVTIVAAIFLRMPAMLRRSPLRQAYWTNAVYWLAPERREESLRRIGNDFAWAGAATLAFIAYANELMIDARAAGVLFDVKALMIGLGTLFIVLANWVAAMQIRYRLPDRSGAGSRA